MGIADTLKDNTIKLLNESAVSWLNFKFNGVVISSTNYNSVRDYITNGKITCTVDATKVANGASATYNNDKKVIYGKENDTQYFDQRSTLIHECAHAQMDIQKVSTDILTDETCAYLAQGLYMFIAAKQNLFDPGLASEAYKAVKKKNPTVTGTPNLTTPIEFSSTDVTDLQSKIKVDPLYKNWAAKSVYKGFP